MKERDIKFRIWDTDEEKWLEDWIGINNNGVVYQSDGRDEGDLSLHDSSIIQQFTGFKDKKKKEIYEGDILQSKEGWMYGKMSLEIKWDSKGGRWMACNKKANVDWDLGEGFSKELEVIGNIFQNKELLNKYQNKTSIACI